MIVSKKMDTISEVFGQRFEYNLIIVRGGVAHPPPIVQKGAHLIIFDTEMGDDDTGPSAPILYVDECRVKVTLTSPYGVIGVEESSGETVFVQNDRYMDIKNYEKEIMPFFTRVDLNLPDPIQSWNNLKKEGK